MVEEFAMSVLGQTGGGLGRDARETQRRAPRNVLHPADV